MFIFKSNKSASHVRFNRPASRCYISIHFHILFLFLFHVSGSLLSVLILFSKLNRLLPTPSTLLFPRPSLFMFCARGSSSITSPHHVASHVACSSLLDHTRHPEQKRYQRTP
uniref:(northern house mosquito) hypothetical protein n=1 Tax=Culex pipiens TaxID=7175 RepID=A0A8D8CJ00_CULPI